VFWVWFPFGVAALSALVGEWKGDRGGRGGRCRRRVGIAPLVSQPPDESRTGPCRPGSAVRSALADTSTVTRWADV